MTIADNSQLEERVENLGDRVTELGEEFAELRGELKPVIAFFHENGNALKFRISELEEAEKARRRSQSSRITGWIGQALSGLISAVATLVGAWIMLGG